MSLRPSSTRPVIASASPSATSRPCQGASVEDAAAEVAEQRRIGRPDRGGDPVVDREPKHAVVGRSGGERGRGAAARDEARDDDQVPAALVERASRPRSPPSCRARPGRDGARAPVPDRAAEPVGGRVADERATPRRGSRSRARGRRSPRGRRPRSPSTRSGRPGRTRRGRQTEDDRVGPGPRDQLVDEAASRRPHDRVGSPRWSSGRSRA